MTVPPLPIEDIPKTLDEGVVLLGYGPGGTGKTEFGGSIGSRGIVLDLSGGAMTLSSPGFRKRNPESPKIVRIREDHDPKTGIFKNAEAFDKVCDFLDWFLECPDFDTLTIDDATFLNTYARNKALVITSQMMNSGTLTKSREIGFVNADVVDYGKEMAMIQWLFTTYIPAFKAKKKNLIVLAHERHIFKKGAKLGETILDRIIPAFTGQTFPDTVQLYFDFVWKFEVVNGTAFRIKTIGTKLYLAKTRWSGVFSEEESNLKFTDVLKRIKGN